MTALAYIRKSSTPGNGSVSYDMQERATRELAARHGDELPDMTDSQFSATVRAAFAAFNDRRFADFATYMAEDVVHGFDSPRRLHPIEHESGLPGSASSYMGSTRT